MKLHIQEVIKRHLSFWLFCLTSAFAVISMIVNFRAVAMSKKPILIAIDTNGTRIISDPSDPIYKTEALVFIQKFITNVYNFTPDNFMQKMGPATAMMSEDLWKAKKSEILSLKDKVETEEISLSTKIIRITKDDLQVYHLLLETNEKTRLNTQTHQIQVSLKLRAITRTSENPTGLEVEEYEEQVVR